MEKRIHAPGATDDFVFDFSGSGALPDGEEISSASVEVDAQLTATVSSTTATTATIRVSDGTAMEDGAVHALVLRATTTSGLAVEWPLLLEIFARRIDERKDPDEVKDFRVKLSVSGELGTGETITSHSATALDAGITVASSAHTASTGTIRLSGGTAGNTYRVALTLGTSAGQVKVFTYYVAVEANA